MNRPDTDTVTIPVTNAAGHYILMDEPDWRAWRGAGMPTCFYLNRIEGARHYVVVTDTKAAGGYAYVHRWLMKPTANQRVEFSTANHLDLRRANLKLVTRKTRTKRRGQHGRAAVTANTPTTTTQTN